MSGSPDEVLGDLFSDVQLRQVYADGKTFLDLVPKRRAKELVKEYQLLKQDPHFDLNEFVTHHFYELPTALKEKNTTKHPSGLSAREHVRWLWPHLTRTTYTSKGSLYALPHPYIVPGGRFVEQFYWDGYFIMLGLAADGEWDMLHGMMRNYIYMADKLGYIPTANRSYLTSRSQPPLFAMMVHLLATHQNKLKVFVECLPTLINEYTFWMKGSRRVAKSHQPQSYRRVVRMPGGELLNRYFDNKTTPRPESHREDITTAEGLAKNVRDGIFLDLRAGAESGWDFSSRWFSSSQDIHTIQTTNYVPVDLNCLLYIAEMTIADSYKTILQPVAAAKYRRRAKARATAIQRYMWSDEGWFEDYDIHRAKCSSHSTIAGVYPLYAGIATSDQAAQVVAKIEKDFLKEGGLVTSLIVNGQQWDAPNGWAPLHWVAIVGLRNYGYDKLADRIKQRWMHTIESIYDTHGKMVEKYDVVTAGKLGGGGEYLLQDGFGWTNGVYAALYDDMDVADKFLINKKD